MEPFFFFGGGFKLDGKMLLVIFEGFSLKNSALFGLVI